MLIRLGMEGIIPVDEQLNPRTLLRRPAVAIATERALRREVLCVKTTREPVDQVVFRCNP